jgi:hypothetical protein
MLEEEFQSNTIQDHELERINQAIMIGGRTTKMEWQQQE